MLKRLNYTGRKKLDACRAAFTLTAGAGGAPSCTVRLDLDGLELPAGAAVVGETRRTYDTEAVRTDLGPVGGLRPGQAVDLGGFGAGDRLMFDVLVVEPGSGRLLAVRRGVTPGEPVESGRLSLFAVEVRDLDAEPWFTEFGEEGATLVLNSAIPDAMEKIRTAGPFRSLVLGSAFRQVLLRLWAAEAQSEDEDEPDGWQARWLAFAGPLAGRAMDSWDDPAEAGKWVDDACNAFAKRNSLTADLQQGEPV